MAKTNTKTTMMSLATLAILLPLASGCAVTARGVFAPPTVSIRATLPMPPTVVVTAAAPTVVASAVTTPAVIVPPDDGIELGAPQNVYEVAVDVAPPPAPSIVVTTPAPRRGFVWVTGHYSWNGRRWVWNGGSWIREHAGQIWVAPRYEASRRIWIRGHFVTMRSSVTTVRPMPEPETAPAPAPVTTSSTTSSSASASAGFHIGFSAEAHASTN
jgi:hypothetical protein